MTRFLFFVFCALVSVGLRAPAAAQAGAAGLPPRPVPFRFVNDQARLLAPADAKRLETGLRRYADTTGTQVVVVIVPTLGGRPVADYGRALGKAWGVGQRARNNGIVLLLGAKERQVTIQPGSGLEAVITPAVTRRVIAQMAPGFKQGNYFAGLRKGLSTLMLTANPTSNPDRNPAMAAAAAGSADPAGPNPSNEAGSAVAPLTNDPIMARPAPEPASSGLGLVGLLLGALVVLVVGGGLIWLLWRLFRSRRAANTPTATPPNVLPNNRPAGSAGYGPGPVGGGYGGGGGGLGGGLGGVGLGGILATGAAAAAGAYLGNRMASGNDAGVGNGVNTDSTAPRGSESGTTADQGAGAAGTGAAAGLGAGAAGTGAADDYFAARDAETNGPAPDYFSDENVAADSASTDYFPDNDNSSYDDTSSDDTGGGGFDNDSDSSDNSGSW